MALKYFTDDDLKTILQSKQFVVVLYSLENENDLKMSRILERIAENSFNELNFCVIKLAGDPKRARQQGVTSAPIIRIFAKGKPVAQLAGLHPRNAITQMIESVVNQPVEELKTLSDKELEIKVVTGEWMNAVTSGLVSGAAFGFALHYLHGVAVFIVPVAAVVFFIFNDNFRFSSQQKALAIILMLLIGLLGDSFFRWAFAS